MDSNIEKSTPHDVHSVVTLEENATASYTKHPTKPKRVVDSRIKKTILLFLITLSVFLAVFPSAGLGSVLGLVAADLHGSEDMSWYMTVSSLSSTISQLLSVRISDCLGRRRTLLASTCFIFVASLVAGFSVDSKMFIVCRLVRGCSIGMVLCITTAALVDLFDMKDRLKYQPFITTSMGVSYIFGPLLGSLFAEHLSWRCIFWFTAILFVVVNIGFYYLIDIPLQPEQRLSKENLKTLMNRIDPIGCFFIASGIALFLLAMHFGSTSRSYTWSSPLVIGFFAGSGLLFLIFLGFEKFVTPHPLFPSPVVLDIHLMLCYVQQFINGWNFILCDLLLFIQYQAVENLTPTEASLRLLPASIIHVAATVVAGKISYKFEKPKIVNIAGNIASIIGICLLLFVQTIDTGSVVKVIFITIFEIGMAFCDVATGLCSQLVLEKKAPHLVATSVSLIRCSMSCGITIGAAFVLSLLQSQSIADVNALQTSQPDTYNELMRYDAAYNYDKVRYIPSTSLKQTLNIMYYENIRTITYGFLVAGVISLVSAIFIKVPSISKTSLEETSKE